MEDDGKGAKRKEADGKIQGQENSNGDNRVAASKKNLEQLITRKTKLTEEAKDRTKAQNRGRRGDKTSRKKISELKEGVKGKRIEEEIVENKIECMKEDKSTKSKKKGASKVGLEGEVSNGPDVVLCIDVDMDQNNMHLGHMMDEDVRLYEVPIKVDSMSQLGCMEEGQNVI